MSRIPGNCHKKRDLLFRLEKQGVSLTKIAKAIGTNPTHVKNYLKKHGIVRQTNYGSPGAKNPAWKGGRFADKQGYILVYDPTHPNARKTGYVPEHRLKMAKKLGRPLLKKEVVHHKNGKVDDNRLQNLELFSSNGAHLRVTLNGQTPDWTAHGIHRMKQGIVRSAKNRRPETHVLSIRDVRQFRENASRSPV
jgi:hypothetical protein